MKNFLTFIQLLSLIFAGSLLISCSDDSDSAYLKNSEQFEQMTPEEQVVLAPTDIARAIFMNDDEAFNKFLEDSYLDFGKKNDEGDTALAIAIKLRRTQFINPLLAKATYEDLLIHNKGHRSFLSLIAEYNYESALDIIQAKYLGQIEAWGYVDSNFDQLDFPDDLNRRAGHYAQTATFIDRLEWMWFYGVVDFMNPWDSFYNHRDINGDTFIHTAAQFDKTEIIKWFVDRRCNGAWFMEDEWWFPVIRAVGTGLRKTTEAFQDSPIFLKKIINVQNDLGNTPLHLAAKNGNSRSIELLLQCDEIDPSMHNWSKQNPVTALMASIDPQQSVIPDNYKKSYQLLADLVDPLWFWLPNMTFKNMVTELDSTNTSAIHYASRMRDTFFYEALKKYEDGTTDHQGVLPQDRHR